MTTNNISLIADSGSTKTTWCMLDGNSKKTFTTLGINPHFISDIQLQDLLKSELVPKLKKRIPERVFYYGAGCGDEKNVKKIKEAIRKILRVKKVHVETDLTGSAIALCSKKKGMVCILGTGSNSCFFNGKKITKNNPSLGYVLGDEGSGSYLGKMVLQHQLSNIFEPDLQERFLKQFPVTRSEVLYSIYRDINPNKYIAQFSKFLSDNRGHYMIENILEDGLNDFFYKHLIRYAESWNHPIHFSGSVAFAFKDVIQQLCKQYGFECGLIIKDPMPGLIKHHNPHH